jgi:hypothetical protein
MEYFYFMEYEEYKRVMEESAGCSPDPPAAPAAALGGLFGIADGFRKPDRLMSIS